VKFILPILISFLLCSCAAGLAATGQKSPLSDDIGIGSTQSEIESLFGLREKTMIIGNNERIDFYKYRDGANPSIARAGIQGAFTYGTKGVWDVLGIPFEEYLNRNKILAVTYNKDNVAMDVRIMDQVQDSRSSR